MEYLEVKKRNIRNEIEGEEGYGEFETKTEDEESWSTLEGK